MPQITPLTAAALADGVYGIETEADVQRGVFARRSMVLPGAQGPQPLGSYQMLDAFDVSGAALTGETGAAFYKPRTGFAMVLSGKGRHQGEVALVCRGTSAGHDWLTNANMALEPGPGGVPVHAGFNRTYKSIQAGVDAALRGRNPSMVHVVGHSLGGALATLFAADLAGRGLGVALYTFGAPRAGLASFSDRLERSLGSDGIRRVYAMADVVPMVPLWPFFHAPRNPGGIRVASGGHGLSVDAHYMDNYQAGVRDASWHGLLAASAAVPHKKSIDFWLDQATDFAARPLSSFGLYALGKGLELILELAERTLGLFLVRAVSTLDKLVFLVSKAAELAGEVAEYVLRFVRIALSWLGKAGRTVVQLTGAFLQYVLDMMMQSVLVIARRALS